MIVMRRVESVSRARCVRSNSSRVRPMTSAALGMSVGCLTVTLGLGALARHGQAGEARFTADLLGRELVQRDRIAKPGPARALHAGQKAGRSLMSKPRTHPRMRQPGDDRVFAAEILEHFQVGSRFVIF